MYFKHILLCFFAFLMLGMQQSKAQVSFDKLIQINGVVMTSDSLYGVPDVIVSVKNQNKGTYTSELGVFSIVCFKGDTLQFRSLGFKADQYIIPDTIKGNSIAMVKLMSQDTFYLNEVVIHALPSKENFNFVFQNIKIDDDKFELARQNSNMAMLRLLGTLQVASGGQNQQFIQNQNAYRAAYSGQQQPMGLFSPIKWAQFIDAWKRGDFRKKQ